MTIDQERQRTPGHEWTDREEVTVTDSDDEPRRVLVWAHYSNGDTGPDPQEGPSVEVLKVCDAQMTKMDITDEVDLEEIENTLYRREFGDE